MAITPIESLPQVWVEERDAPFFRLMSRTFSADFLSAAGVLLASYDRHDEPALWQESAGERQLSGLV